MPGVNENISCYSSDVQRKLLAEFAENIFFRDNFFLTGGTALSVFYLHHRKSDDLDFFTVNEIGLSDIDFWVLRRWEKVNKINETQYFISYLINETKVDIVIDALSLKQDREKIYFDTKKWFFIDSLQNIASNKFCVLVSRSEVKDYLDFYYMNSDKDVESIDEIYSEAAMKDAIFEDPPTVAYQIEQGYRFVIKNKLLLPKLLVELDEDKFRVFYENLVRRIYKKIN